MNSLELYEFILYAYRQRDAKSNEVKIYLYVKKIQVLQPVAVLGFCIWGANGADIFVWGD